MVECQDKVRKPIFVNTNIGHTTELLEVGGSIPSTDTSQ